MEGILDANMISLLNLTPGIVQKQVADHAGSHDGGKTRPVDTGS